VANFGLMQLANGREIKKVTVQKIVFEAASFIRLNRVNSCPDCLVNRCLAPARMLT
jgi:hypothetical protein